MTTTQTRWILSTNPDAPPDRLRDYQAESVVLRRALTALRCAARPPAPRTPPPPSVHRLPRRRCGT